MLKQGIGKSAFTYEDKLEAGWQEGRESNRNREARQTEHGLKHRGIELWFLRPNSVPAHNLFRSGLQLVSEIKG
jgi:hypothetical protein